MLGQLRIKDAKNFLSKSIEQNPDSEMLLAEFMKIDKNLKILEAYEQKNSLHIPDWYKGPALSFGQVELTLSKHPPPYAHEVLKARRKLLRLASSKLLWQQN